jgi:hypothetical protein
MLTSRQRRWFFQLGFVCLLSLITFQMQGEPAGQEKEMSNQISTELLEVAANSQNDLSLRLRAIQDLTATNDKSFVPRLKTLLQRPSPEIREKPKNWDPEAAERMVDLAIVAALHTLGDDSEVQRLPVLVAHAGGVLQDPRTELDYASEVILKIGRVEPIAGLLALANEQDPRSVRNSVRTLDRLRLPEAPVGGNVSSIPHMQDRVSFTINRLKEELRAIEQNSHGSIVLSLGVSAFLLDHDYDRGTVRRQGVLLADMVEKTIPLLDFDYFVEQNRVVICTHLEAATRWRTWWAKYAQDLRYRKDKSIFVLKRME